MHLFRENPDVINLVLFAGFMILAGINLYMTLMQ